MKLYYMPGACSLASHIVLREVGADFTLDKVDTVAMRTQAGADYARINPKGKVPVLQTDDGNTLTEGPAILQYIADSAGYETLAPAAGTMARARMTEVLNFTATELHVAFHPLFSANATDAAKAEARSRVGSKFDWLESLLSDGRAYLTGGDFTVADSYAFVASGWSATTGIDLAAWPRLAAFVQLVRARPSVQAALQAEGLV
ncbi:MAG: glutathione transferase GstA [Paracoccaceae bacterium]